LAIAFERQALQGQSRL